MFGMQINRRHPLWRPLTARQRGLMLGLGLLATPAVALAAYLALIAGSVTVTTRTFGPFVFASPVQCVEIEQLAVGDVSCVVTGLAGETSFTVTIGGAYPDAGGDVALAIKNNGSMAGFVAPLVTTTPTGLDVTFDSCGVRIDPGATQAMGIRILVNDQADPGQSLGPFDASVNILPGAQSCP